MTEHMPEHIWLAMAEVEKLARHYCKQENEIWEEAGDAKQHRWRREAEFTLGRTSAKGGRNAE